MRDAPDTNYPKPPKKKKKPTKVQGATIFSKTKDPVHTGPKTLPSSPSYSPPSVSPTYRPVSTSRPTYSKPSISKPAGPTTTFADLVSKLTGSLPEVESSTPSFSQALSTAQETADVDKDESARDRGVKREAETLVERIFGTEPKQEDLEVQGGTQFFKNRAPGSIPMSPLREESVLDNLREIQSRHNPETIDMFVKDMTSKKQVVGQPKLSEFNPDDLFTDASGRKIDPRSRREQNNSNLPPAGYPGFTPPKKSPFGMGLHWDLEFVKETVEAAGESGAAFYNGPAAERYKAVSDALVSQARDRANFLQDKLFKQTQSITTAFSEAQDAAFDGEFKALSEIQKEHPGLSLSIPAYRQMFGITPKYLQKQMTKELDAAGNDSALRTSIVERYKNLNEAYSKIRTNVYESRQFVKSQIRSHVRKIKKSAKVAENKSDKDIDTDALFEGIPGAIKPKVTEGSVFKKLGIDPKDSMAMDDLVGNVANQKAEEFKRLTKGLSKKELKEAGLEGESKNPYVNSPERWRTRREIKQEWNIKHLPTIEQMLEAKVFEGVLDLKDEAAVGEWIKRFRNPNHPQTLAMYASFAAQEQTDPQKWFEEVAAPTLNRPYEAYNADLQARQEHAAKIQKERDHDAIFNDENTEDSDYSWSTAFGGGSPLLSDGEDSDNSVEGIAESFKDSGTTLMWTFDKLMRPLYAVSGMYDAWYALDQDNKGPAWWMRITDPLSNLTGQSAWSSFDEVYGQGGRAQGLDDVAAAGKNQFFRGSSIADEAVQPMTFSNVIANAAARNPDNNWYDSSVYQEIAGFALDMVLDPLNYVGVGIAKNAFRGGMYGMSPLRKKAYDAQQAFYRLNVDDGPGPGPAGQLDDIVPDGPRGPNGEPMDQELIDDIIYDEGIYIPDAKPVSKPQVKSNDLVPQSAEVGLSTSVVKFLEKMEKTGGIDAEIAQAVINVSEQYPGLAKSIGEVQLVDDPKSYMEIDYDGKFNHLVLKIDKNQVSGFKAMSPDELEDGWDISSSIYKETGDFTQALEAAVVHEFGHVAHQAYAAKKSGKTFKESWDDVFEDGFLGPQMSTSLGEPILPTVSNYGSKNKLEHFGEWFAARHYDRVKQTERFDDFVENELGVSPAKAMQEFREQNARIANDSGVETAVEGVTKHLDQNPTDSAPVGFFKADLRAERVGAAFAYGIKVKGTIKNAGGEQVQYLTNYGGKLGAVIQKLKNDPLVMNGVRNKGAMIAKTKGDDSVSVDQVEANLQKLQELEDMEALAKAEGYPGIAGKQEPYAKIDAEGSYAATERNEKGQVVGSSRKGYFEGFVGKGTPEFLDQARKAVDEDIKAGRVTFEPDLLKWLDEGGEIPSYARMASEWAKAAQVTVDEFGFTDRDILRAIIEGPAMQRNHNPAVYDLMNKAYGQLHQAKDGIRKFNEKGLDNLTPEERVALGSLERIYALASNKISSYTIDSAFKWLEGAWEYTSKSGNPYKNPGYAETLQQFSQEVDEALANELLPPVGVIDDTLPNARAEYDEASEQYLTVENDYQNMPDSQVYKSVELHLETMLAPYKSIVEKLRVTPQERVMMDRARSIKEKYNLSDEEFKIVERYSQHRADIDFADKPNKVLTKQEERIKGLLDEVEGKLNTKQIRLIQGAAKARREHKLDRFDKQALEAGRINTDQLIKRYDILQSLKRQRQDGSVKVPRVNLEPYIKELPRFKQKDTSGQGLPVTTQKYEGASKDIRKEGTGLDPDVSDFAENPFKEFNFDEVDDLGELESLAFPFSDEQRYAGKGMVPRVFGEFTSREGFLQAVKEGIEFQTRKEHILEPTKTRVLAKPKAQKLAQKIKRHLPLENGKLTPSSVKNYIEFDPVTLKFQWHGAKFNRVLKERGIRPSQRRQAVATLREITGAINDAHYKIYTDLNIKAKIAADGPLSPDVLKKIDTEARQRALRETLDEINTSGKIKATAENGRLNINQQAKVQERQIKTEAQIAKERIKANAAELPLEQRAIELDKIKAVDKETKAALRANEVSRREAHVVRASTSGLLRSEEFLATLSAPPVRQKYGVEVNLAGLKVNLSFGIDHVLHSIEKAAQHIPGKAMRTYKDTFVRPTKQVSRLSRHDAEEARAIWTGETPTVVQYILRGIDNAMADLPDEAIRRIEFQRFLDHPDADDVHEGLKSVFDDIESAWNGENDWFKIKDPISGVPVPLSWSQLNRFMPEGYLMDIDYLRAAVKDHKKLKTADLIGAIKSRNKKEGIPNPTEIKDPHALAWKLELAASMARQLERYHATLNTMFGVKREAKYINRKTGRPVGLTQRGQILEEQAKKAGWVTVPQLGNTHYFPPEMVEDMKALLAFTDPSRLKELKWIDTAIGYWKSGMTVYNPGYYTRNGIGEIMVSWMDGVNHPKWYKRSKDVINYVTKNDQDLAAIVRSWDVLGDKVAVNEVKGNKVIGQLKGGFQYTAADVFEYATKHGVMSTFLRTDLGGSSLRQMGADIHRSGGAFARKRRAISEGVHEFGEHYEDWLRIAHFIHAMEHSGKGTLEAAATYAAKRVRRSHFDYTDFSHAEKVVLGRAFPFFKWTRRGAPLMLAHLFMTPGKMVAPLKAQDTISGLFSARDVNEDPNGVLPDYDGIAPQWVVDLFSYQMGPAPDDEYADYMRLATPQTDALGAAFNPLENAVLPLANPMLKLPAEQAINRSLDPDFPFQIRGGEYNESHEINDLEAIGSHTAKSLNPWTKFIDKMSKDLYSDREWAMGDGGYDKFRDVLSQFTGLGFYQGMRQDAFQSQDDISVPNTDAPPVGYQDLSQLPMFSDREVAQGFRPKKGSY